MTRSARDRLQALNRALDALGKPPDSRPVHPSAQPTAIDPDATRVDGVPSLSSWLALRARAAAQDQQIETLKAQIARVRQAIEPEDTE